MAPQKRIIVVNPEAERVPVPNEKAAAAKTWPMAKRPDSLNGKTIYLVNQGFGGSELFMRQLQAWFADQMPDVKTVQRRKTGFIFRDDTKDLWEEIKEKGDAVIFGVAG
jgi:hypothetical protein